MATRPSSAQLAQELFRAARSGEPVQLLSERVPDLDWSLARAVARETDALRAAAGDRQVGWKLGWTSAVMREALGVDRPNWGTLWDSQIAEYTVELESLIHPKVEPELVWRAGADLAGEVTAEDVRACGGEWALGIEVVDPRFPSFSFDALDNTADNSSSAAVRLGSFVSLEAAGIADLTTQQVHFASSNNSANDNNETRSGFGSQTMGDPFEAIAWLVASLAEEGLSLRRDEIAGPGTRANIDEFTETTAKALEVVGGASLGKAIIVLNPAEPPLIMRNTVFCLTQTGEPDDFRNSITEMVERVQSYVPGYRLKQDVQVDRISDADPIRIPELDRKFTGWKISVFLEVEGAGHYLPPYAGNLDIMTSAALRTAEEIAALGANT